MSDACKARILVIDDDPFFRRLLQSQQLIETVERCLAQSQH